MSFNLRISFLQAAAAALCSLWKQKRNNHSDEVAHLSDALTFHCFCYSCILYIPVATTPFDSGGDGGGDRTGSGGDVILTSEPSPSWEVGSGLESQKQQRRRPHPRKLSTPRSPPDVPAVGWRRVVLEHVPPVPAAECTKFHVPSSQCVAVVFHHTQSDNSVARSADCTSSRRSGCRVTKSQDGKKRWWWYHPPNVPVETG